MNEPRLGPESHGFQPTDRMQPLLRHTNLVYIWAQLSLSLSSLNQIVNGAVFVRCKGNDNLRKSQTMKISTVFMNYAIVSEIASNITLSLYPNIVINQCRHSSILCRWYQFNLLTNEQTSERQHQSAHDNAHWTQIILVILLMNNLLQQQNIIKSSRSLCVVRWMWFDWKVSEIMLRILLVQQNGLNTAKLLV